MIGQTFGTIIARQFENLRAGDRLWFENQGFDAKVLNQIEHTTLSDIIARNTDTKYLQDDAFVFYNRHSGTAGGVASEDPEAPQLVIGSDGTDTLVGGPQGDKLVAGKGDQTMTGGGGNDQFVVGKGATRATITDFTAQDKIDFADISPATVQQPTFSGNASGGTLTVTDGTHTANVALLGNYLASTFVPSSDGHGGTSVVDQPSAQALVAQPHHA